MFIGGDVDHIHIRRGERISSDIDLNTPTDGFFDVFKKLRVEMKIGWDDGDFFLCLFKKPAPGLADLFLVQRFAGKILV